MYGGLPAPLGDGGPPPQCVSAVFSRLSRLKLSTWQNVLLSLGLNEVPCWE